MMDAVFIDKPYHIKIKKVEEDILGPNDVRIKVKMAGICGSDIHAYKGLHPFRIPPVLIGHEVVGKVIEVGQNVTKAKIGDKVAVEPQKGCGKCEYCLKGSINYCKERMAPGVGEWKGAMAENFVTSETTVFVLPNNMKDEMGVLVEPLAVCVHAVRKAKVNVGDKVAVLGSGPIGLLTIGVVKEAGATTILATDVFDYCLKHAEEIGATNSVNVDNKKNWIKEIISSLGYFDKVFVAVEAPNIVNEALALLNKGGKVITIAMFHEEQKIDIMQLQNEEKEVIGSFCYNWGDTSAAVSLLHSERIPYESVITHVLPYQEASVGFEIVDKKLEDSIKVLLDFTPSSV